MVLGASGLALSFIGSANRGSLVIGLGLFVMGLSHLVSGHYHGLLGDMGGLILLLGLGIMIGTARRSRKRGDSGGR